MKVLMIGPDRSVHGGISAIVNNYYLSGLDKKISLKYIGTMKEGSKAKKLLIAATAYIRYSFSLPSCDLVHVHLASDNSFWRKSFFIKQAYRKGKKIIIHQHGGDFKNYYANQISEEKRQHMDRILNMADKMIVLTPSWKDYFSDIVDPDKITVIPNGVILPTNTKDPQTDNTGSGNTADSNAPDDRNTPKQAHDVHKILYLGRICTDKGIGELIDAVTVLHNEDPAIELYLGGIYETRTESDLAIKKRIEENSDYIHYLGWISGNEKESVLDECGICALPSYFEGFGLVIIEAMGHGCIAVASAVGGIPEIIDDNVNGILVTPKDSTDLAKKMAGVINNPDLISYIKQNAYKTVSEKYSMDAVISKLLSVYDSVTASGH